MWKELRDCHVGDYIKATFLGNRDPADSADKNWHQIYQLELKSNGKCYAAIEGFGGKELYGTEDVYVQ